MSNVNAVHPWLTMPHSPQHLFKLFTYNLTSGLQQLPPSLCCQHVLFYSWPAHLRSAAAQCASCAGQYRFSGLRENSAALSFSISSSRAFFQTSHISSTLSFVHPFSCEAYRFLSAFLALIYPCSYFSFGACNPCILWSHQVNRVHLTVTAMWYHGGWESSTRCNWRKRMQIEEVVVFVSICTHFFSICMCFFKIFFVQACPRSNVLSLKILKGMYFPISSD